MFLDWIGKVDSKKLSGLQQHDCAELPRASDKCTPVTNIVADLYVVMVITKGHS